MVEYVRYENFVDCEGTDRTCTGAVVAEEKKIPSAYLPSQSGKNKQSNGESHDLNARITRLHVKLDSYSMFLI